MHKPVLPAIAAGVLLLFGLALASAAPRDDGSEGGERPDAGAATDTATFGGGCFWCMEPPFEALDGVASVTSGYMGGHTTDPTYEQVSAGRTGHAEVVMVIYDPRRVSYETLLDLFWHNVDPLTADAQFCDNGSQYRSAIFAHGDRQRRAAIASRSAMQGRFDRPIVTEVNSASTFYRAEEYHQDYHRKNPVRYKLYRWNCGRDQRLRSLWGEAAGRGTRQQ